MNLRQDIIKINNKKILINPFLYSRKLDKKTNIWLRKPSQISLSRIDINRNRFYPDINWEVLSLNEKFFKDSTIELFLKTLEIIKKSNPDLNSEELLEVERQLIYHQKVSFEKWSKKYFIKKERLLLNEKRQLERADSFKKWQQWFSLKETQKLLTPMFVIIVSSILIGWFAGISKNSCNPYFESYSSNQL